MFWVKKENTNRETQENCTERPLNQLHLFTASYAGDNLSGISISPFSGNEDISREILRTFEWNGNKVLEHRQNYWRHAFIYHHDIPSSVSLGTIRERCYQHPVELQVFIDAVREYKRATLTQEYVSEKLDALKEAKKNLLLVVI
jgi:hypothetical protein